MGAVRKTGKLASIWKCRSVLLIKITIQPQQQYQNM
jgi:hypothetical protein